MAKNIFQILREIIKRSKSYDPTVDDQIKKLLERAKPSNSYDLTGNDQNTERSEQRKASALERLRYAAREFGKAAPKAGLVLREKQVGIDLENKLFLDHENGLLMCNVQNQKTYYYEVGTKDKKSYMKPDDTEVLAKRFSLQEQLDNTKLVKQTDQQGYVLYNQDGASIYDTSDKTSKEKVGEVAYAITYSAPICLDHFF